MTDDRAISRLERLGTTGALDKVKAALDKAPPILDEFGFSADAVRAALGTRFDQLESVGMRASQLEAIVRAVGRPPLIVRNGKIEGTMALADDFDAGISGRIAAVEPFVGSVGRIEFINHDMAWGGTGWVIEDDGTTMLIATNRHVAKLVARRTANGDGTYMFSPASVRYGARIDFGEEADVPPDPTRVLKIEKFTYLADDAAADVAIARVTRPDAGVPIGALPLATNDGDDQETVAVIGYPASDPFRNDPTEMQNYFKDIYDVKRFAPGFLRVQDTLGILGHDCTTLGGNSGSPVISLEQKGVVGLHFAGTYGVGNSAVRVSTLKGLLDQTTTVVPVPDEVAAVFEDPTHDADHFAGREGYDPNFLRVVNVPLPTIPDALDLAKPSDKTAERPHELRYQHFGVLYSLAKKSPVIAALNIDGDQTRRIKRSNSRWWKDLRIPADKQLGRDDYDDPEIDRGHMVRRAATNWGPDMETARRANLDSFHYTAASPQHEGLNQNTATWLGLEDHIMDNVRTFGFRANVFTGPVFSDDDPPLGDSGAPIPLHYFKVVTMLAEDENATLRLHATAYVLSQGQLIQQLLLDQGLAAAVEGFTFGAFRTFQVRIDDLETMTGYDFGPLRDADPLAKPDEAPVRVQPLDRLEQIRL